MFDLSPITQCIFLIEEMSAGPLSINYAHPLLIVGHGGS